MNKLKIKNYLKYLALIILAFIMKSYFTIDYNWATLLITSIIIYLEIGNKNNNWKRNFLIGLIAGLSITLKQTTGIVITLATIGYRIFSIRNKEDFKIFFKNAIIKLLGALIFPTMMIIILISLGAFKDYIDYCILGVATFSNKISYINGLIKNSNILIRVLSVMPIVIYIGLAYLYIKKQKDEILTILIFSIIQMILIYPIADSSHFVVAIPPTLIGFAYILNYIIEQMNVPIKEEFILESFLAIAVTMIVVIVFIHGINNYLSQNINTELKHFKYLPMSEDGISNIKEIEEYIENQEKPVYILDATAALYMIPIDRYNKNYDMFNKGNLGSRGEEGQIEDLENLSQKIILIRNENYIRNWQNPEKVRKYIIDNMNKTGEIGIFEIYE